MDAGSVVLGPLQKKFLTKKQTKKPSPETTTETKQRKRTKNKQTKTPKTNQPKNPNGLPSEALLLLTVVSIFHPRVSPAQVVQKNPVMGAPQHQPHLKNAKSERQTDKSDITRAWQKERSTNHF